MGQYEENKKVYDVEYYNMKKEGLPFHPFTTWKDIVVAFAILILLLSLTYLFGVELDAPADPTSHYLPRPEWYFMFLFELLKFFPGPLEVIATAIIPGIVVGAMVLLPFYDRNPYRSLKHRPVAAVIGGLFVVGLVGLTALSYYQDANDPAVQAMKAASSEGGAPTVAAATGGGAADGGAIFSAKCVMCHGAKGDQMAGVKLFDKAFMANVNIEQNVRNGNAKGMPPVGKDLSADQIKAVVSFVKSQQK